MNLKKTLLSIAIFFLSIYFFTGLSFAQESNKGTVTVSVLNLRSGPGTSYEILGKVNEGKQLTILGNFENWYIVNASSGLFGWVLKDHISLKAAKISRGEDISRESAVAQDKASEIISFAKTYMGVNYVWGGTTPNGFDCSGFVKYVYNHFGISLNRVARDQAKEGTYVSKNDLVPSDLVFFDTDRGNKLINHVGIYIGNGQFIQASSGHGEVVITDLTKGFYDDTYMTARRILD